MSILIVRSILFAAPRLRGERVNDRAHMLAFHRGDRFVAMLDPKIFDDVPIGRSRGRSKRRKGRRIEADTQIVDGSGLGPRRADRSRRIAERCLIYRHELRRSGCAGERDTLHARSPEISAEPAVAIGELLDVREPDRRHCNTLSHSFG
jgi:hypothetical protein